MDSKTKNSRAAGFTMIVLLISVVLVVLLSLYAYSRTMKRVQNSVNEEAPELNVQAPTIQNHQQMLDSVKESLNENVSKGQERLKDAQKELGEKN